MRSSSSSASINPSHSINHHNYLQCQAQDSGSSADPHYNPCQDENFPPPPVLMNHGGGDSESPSNMFFASHKAHRSFRAAVERIHQEPFNPSSNQPLDSTQWQEHWPIQSNDMEMINSKNQIINSAQHPNNLQPASKQKDVNQPPAPYRTRSLVHRLVNPPQQDSSATQAFQPSGSNGEPFFYDNHLSSSQFGPSSSGSNLMATSCSHTVHEPGSAFTSEESSSPYHPPDSRLVQSTFVSNRNKHGLPSNSHHLLNSPELKTAQINQSNQTQSGSTSESQPVRCTRASTHKRQVTTPPKTRNASSHLGNGPAELAPSDDAASILLELSRHEPPKHGMSLRRGRGGGASSLRSDSQPAGSSDINKPPVPPTPNGRRCRTRSQVNGEASSNDQHVCQNPTSGPHSLEYIEGQPTGQSSDMAPGNSNHQASLGYGLPGGYHTNMISVSGSTSASTSTSRSNTGDGLPLNMTSGHDSNLNLYNFLHKAEANGPGRLQLQLSSNGSNEVNMDPASTSIAMGLNGPALFDDETKSCFSISTQATSLISPPGYLARRTFPPGVPIDSNFPRLYRTFFVPSAFGDREPIKLQAEAYKIPVMKAPADSNFNTPAHGYLDLYTPRYVKGVGADKMGLCCICAEPKERGGEDTALWLKMKVSSYSYHLSFFHGINNADGLPFSPPVEIRHVKRCHVAANEKLELKEGRCHQCNQWVLMEGVKMQEVKVPELFWWKHAKSCHKSRLAGECHVHIPDEIFDLVIRHQSMTGSQYNSAGGGGYLPNSSCSTPYSYSYSNGFASNSPYAHLTHPASPAPTCASSGSHSGGTRVHPSVAAQRASAGRVYKRKASSSSLSGKRRETSIMADSPRSSSGQGLPLSMGVAPSAGDPTAMPQSHQYFLPHPQSPTPTQPNYSLSTGRKTRRSNLLN